MLISINIKTFKVLNKLFEFFKNSDKFKRIIKRWEI